jgi:hypothetical protein
MKFLYTSALLLAFTCVAQEPQPLGAPVYRIPLPDAVEKVRSLEKLPNVDDPWERAFLQCLATEDDRARMARTLELITTTPAEHFAAGSRAFEKLDDLGFFGMFLTERDFYWEQFGRLSKQTAQDEAQRLTTKDAARYATAPRKAMRGWAEVEPVAAQKWIDANPGILTSDPLMLRQLVVGWAVTDLKGATDYFIARTKPTAREFQDTLIGLRDFVATRSFSPGLIEWFNSLPEQDTEPTVKSLALPHVLTRIEAGGFLDGAKFLDSIKSPKVATEAVIQRYVSSWTGRGKPQEVLEWLLARPKDEKGNRPGVPIAAQVWAGKDAKGFSQWLLANREHESLDQVLLGFVKYLSVRDIAEARKWAKEIKSAAVRKEAEDFL